MCSLLNTDILVSIIIIYLFLVTGENKARHRYIIPSLLTLVNPLIPFLMKTMKSYLVRFLSHFCRNYGAESPSRAEQSSSCSSSSRGAGPGPGTVSDRMSSSFSALLSCFFLFLNLSFSSLVRDFHREGITEMLQLSVLILIT